MKTIRGRILSLEVSLGAKSCQILWNSVEFNRIIIMLVKFLCWEETNSHYFEVCLSPN